MKKITLLFTFFLAFTLVANAQCDNTLNDGQFGSLNMANDGTVETVSANQWTSEYSDITNLINGDTYEYSVTLNADGSHGYVTIRDAGDPTIVLGHGPSPFQLTAGAESAVQAHWTSDGACTTAQVAHTTTVRNTSVAPPTCPDPSGGTATPAETTADLSWTENGTATAWTVEYGLNMFTPGTGTVVSAGTNTDFQISGLTATTTYDFYVTSNCGAMPGDDDSAQVGPFTFTTTAAAPSNNLCSSAATIDCTNNGGAGYAGDTSNATLDNQGDCTGDADADAPNVWYTLVGDGQDWTVSTCSTAAYDTSIGVFTGACGALTCIAANDDTTGCTGNTSEVTFNAANGTTYYVVVEGWNAGSTGTFTLNVTCTPAATPPPNDDCSGANGAEALVLNDAATTGDNTNATNALTRPSCDTGFNDVSDVWYSFEAPASNMSVSIVTTLIGADQANVAVYDDCALTTEIACSDGNGGETVDIAAGTLTPGATYFVQVWNDGVAGPGEGVEVEGDFTIAISSTLSVDDVEDPNGFSYHPNPVKSALNIKAQNAIESISVFNMLGQEVRRTAPNALETNLDMNGLSNGAYFVQVTINGNTKSIRVIKE